MSFPARYNGHCRECRGPIDVGMLIDVSPGGGAQHADCESACDAGISEDPLDLDHEPPPCPRCWLTICDCEERP